MTPNPGQPPQPGWFKRNWYWLVGGGCLGLMLCCGGVAGVAYFAATTAIKQSGPYIEAVKEVTTNAQVSEALGTPVEMGMMGNSSFNETNGEGSMEFTCPVSGPKGKGTLHGVSHKSKGSGWVTDTLELTLESGKVIDVSGGSGKGLNLPSGGGAKGNGTDTAPKDPTDDVQPDPVNEGNLDKPLIPPGDAPAKDEGAKP